MNRTMSAIALGAVLAFAGVALGQGRQGGSSIPEVGSRLPEVSGYDAEGQPFELTRLHGKHTVIVFGCLT